jgi:hypothetical protein
MICDVDHLLFMYNFERQHGCFAELQGKLLIFILKLDESEIVYGQKLERVSITLMNRALNPDIGKGSLLYFSIQSEREIFPVASFQVHKETHDILKWVLDRSNSHS